MACTKQTASQYVWNARPHLIGRLRCHDLILDNLLQKGVLTLEQVSKVKHNCDDYDKSRNILDQVICKGERSCAEFLKILDATRKWTLEKAPAGVENLGSSGEFDVNHWLSCFSFEDPTPDTSYSQGPKHCHNYQAKLKSKAQKISEISWSQSRKVLFNKKISLSYTPLVLRAQAQTPVPETKSSKMRKGKKKRPKKLEAYLPKEHQNISPGDLLKSREKKILLVGSPGVGKTVVVHQILKLWAEKENKELDYVFYFDMRETTCRAVNHKLEDLLFSVFSEPNRGKEEVLEDLKNNSDSVTIILDGVTDCQPPLMSELMQKNLLPDAKIIITCRPEVEFEDFLCEWDPFRVEVQGFSERSITDYLSKLLSEEHLHKVLHNLELFTLCYIPMYALMVAACFSFEGYLPQPCTVTGIYLNILNHSILQNRDKKAETKYCEKILSLAEAAFCSTQKKQVNLTSLHQPDCHVHVPFLKTLLNQVCPTVKEPLCAFLHYTVQEFFAALWLVKDPKNHSVFLQQWRTEGQTHMKHLLPFMCGLWNVKNRKMFKYVFPSQQLEETSDQFIRELVTTCVDSSDTEGFDMELPSLCQCLYEYQSPAACLHLLDKLNYCLDLSQETLEPQHCCAVSYIVRQSDRKVQLNLNDTTVSKEGVSLLLGCLSNVQRDGLLSQKLWPISLLAEGQVDYRSLLCFDENQIQLPVYGQRQLLERAVKVIQGSTKKVKVGLYWDGKSPAYQSVSEVLPQCVPNIHSISVMIEVWTKPSEETRFFGNLFCAAAEKENETGEKILERLASVCTYKTFPLKQKWLDFLLDLYSIDSTQCLSVLSSFQSVLQSTPPVWSIKLSEGRSSILLEVLKLQAEKKEVQLTGLSHEESEVRSFLQCLPHISQLSVDPYVLDLQEGTRFLWNLFCAAAERENETGEKILERLASVCTYKTFPLKLKWLDFLLDLYSIDSTTCLSVLPSFQSVLQSTPPVWSIKLSEGRSSILLEVLKLQAEKKEVQLTGLSHEESKVRSFLQCLPHISQLSVHPDMLDLQEGTRFFGNLFCAAAERENETGEKILERLTSVCTYKTFPLKQKWLDFLLDLYSIDRTTCLSVLPSFQSVLQSTHPVWSIKLSEGRSSILLEVLKLQAEKKEVQLTDLSHEESKVRSFLQCLPHISQLSVHPDVFHLQEGSRFFGNLFCAAAERENETGEKILERLTSVCTYKTFPLRQTFGSDNFEKYRSDFLLDLFCHVKDSEMKSGLSVLPSFQSVLQSTPPVWSIKLSEGRSSILLEVLKLQAEKKEVQLTGLSHEESEVRSFLQCLPHISQLSVDPHRSNLQEGSRFFGNLFCAAAERENETGEKILERLASVCTYKTFPLRRTFGSYDDGYRSDFLLDLFCHVKDSEMKSGLSVLPSFQSVLQSTPPVWSIKLSEGRSSILLEVLKLQAEKKEVQLTGLSHEESEVRSFLQCLPHISQLSVPRSVLHLQEGSRFFGNLFCAAAERENETGEKILERLTSVCTYKTFPLRQTFGSYDDGYRSDFLLDLFCHVKDSEMKSGLSVLPSFQSVLQSTPPVWSIELSEGRSSILLEVLKLQAEKKEVQLTSLSHEESEVRSFLQCLPHISQLSYSVDPYVLELQEGSRFFGNLFCAAAERENETGEKILERLTSVCTYKTFPLRQTFWSDDDDEWRIDFLLDLFCHVKDSEMKSGLSVFPSFQSVLQSTHPVWSIKLSEGRSSILLEVLKLQAEKKEVELTGLSHEESEVRSFLQCLPHISQLSVHPRRSNLQEGTRFFGNLFCAAAERENETGEKILERLTSVCTYKTFPLTQTFWRDDDEYQSDFLLDLFCHVKDSEMKSALSVLPSFQSVLQSTPPVWSIKLSEGRSSILLEVLKLQAEKKEVQLTGLSHEESEVRSFLQCLPHISQLSVPRYVLHLQEGTRFFGNLFCAAAERENETGEKILERLTSVCTYKTFPLRQTFGSYDDGYRSDFLLDLFCHVKDSEMKSGLSVLPSFQSVLQSTPPVWSIKLSEGRSSILLEVLKLQAEKKEVQLTGLSHEESEVRSFLQCLPHISQLSCAPDFFQRLCSSIVVRSREDVQQLVSLLELLGFNLMLTGEFSRKSCSNVGRVLQLCGSKVDVTLTPCKISARQTSAIFKHTRQLRRLRLSNHMTLLLFHWIRRGRVARWLAVEELSLVRETAPPSDTEWLKVASGLASLLRYWSARRLDVTQSCIPARCLISLLLHDGSLTVRLPKETQEQLLTIIHEIQDKGLTSCFLSKVGGDLTSCRLTWEMLHLLLQQSSHQTITVDLRRSHFLQKTPNYLFPFLDRILLKRPSPSFVMASIKALYRNADAFTVPSLLQAFDHVINLSCTELDLGDSDALLFILKQTHGVQLNLLWSSIPAERRNSILNMLDRVSHLSVDRIQLLELVHCCAASHTQQEAAAYLLRALQHQLDFSCTSHVDLKEGGQIKPLCVSANDCRAIATVLHYSRQETRLDLRDCELEDGGLDLLFSVLDGVRLRVSKKVLVQLVSLVPVYSERDTMRRAQSLCRALGRQLDLSHTPLNDRVCIDLVGILDFCEGLTELDLSYCRLTDHLLHLLSSQMHKVQDLDLSHNEITDVSTPLLLQLVSNNPFIETVRIFSNKILDRAAFQRDKRFEIW